MAVDWLRSCHATTWRFYGDDPSRITSGRFYFTAKDAPVLPWPHYFGSPVWDNGDFPARTGLGPIAGAPMRWVNGDLGVALPDNHPWGFRHEFIASNAPGPAPPDFPFRNGVPEFCWFSNNDLIADPIEVAAIGSCCLTLAYARVIDLLYEEQWEKIQDFITDWLGAGPTVTFFPLNGLLPARVIITHATFVLIIFGGTDNNEQLAVQAFQGAIPPLPLGGIKTLPLWFNTANAVFADLWALGASTTAPITLAGHSYGAAVAVVMAIRMRNASATRSIQLLTFACPKPCDGRDIDVLDTMKHRHIANYSDLVTVVPTNVIEGAMFVLLVPVPVRFIWSSWATFKATEIYREDGSYFVAANQNLSYDVLLPAIMRWVLGLDWQPQAFHPIKEYIRRLAISCGEACWPISATSWTILFGEGTDGASGLRFDRAIEEFNPEQNANTVHLGSVSIPPPLGHLSGVSLSSEIGYQTITIPYRSGITLG